VGDILECLLSIRKLQDNWRW